jgi:hypothetical protein
VKPARVTSALVAVLAGATLIACGGGGGGGGPGAPQGVTATAGNESVTIQWSAVSGTTSYNLYWSAAPGVTVATGTRIAGVTSPYVHAGRPNGTPCYYVVTAVNAAGESAASSEVSATPAMAVGVWDTSTWDDAVWGP